MNALRALFSEVCNHTQSMFALCGFDVFLDFEIALSESSKSEVKILDVFAEKMRFFQWDQGARMEQFERGSLVRQKKAMKCMRTGFYVTALDVRFSEALVSRTPELPSATSNLSADLNLGSSRLHLRAAYGVSHT